MRPEPFEIQLIPRTPELMVTTLLEANTAREELRIHHLETNVTVKDALSSV